MILETGLQPKSVLFCNLSSRLLLRTFAFTEAALMSCMPDYCQHATSLNSNAIRLGFAIIGVFPYGKKKEKCVCERENKHVRRGVS